MFHIHLVIAAQQNRKSVHPRWQPSHYRLHQRAWEQSFRNWLWILFPSFGSFKDGNTQNLHWVNILAKEFFRLPTLLWGMSGALQEIWCWRGHTQNLLLMCLSYWLLLGQVSGSVTAIIWRSILQLIFLHSTWIRKSSIQLSFLNLQRPSNLRKLLIHWILKKIIQPLAWICSSFKITPRKQNAHAYINGAFKYNLDGSFMVTEKPSIVFGGYGADLGCFLCPNLIDDCRVDRAPLEHTVHSIRDTNIVIQALNWVYVHEVLITLYWLIEFLVL